MQLFGLRRREEEKPINVPVFLIYAGIVHAIGLALLMPMLITLPGPGGGAEPKAASIDVEIIPATPPSPKVEPESSRKSTGPPRCPPAPQPGEASSARSSRPLEAAAKPVPKSEGRSPMSVRPSRRGAGRGRRRLKKDARKSLGGGDRQGSPGRRQKARRSAQQDGQACGPPLGQDQDQDRSVLNGALTGLFNAPPGKIPAGPTPANNDRLGV